MCGGIKPYCLSLDGGFEGEGDGGDGAVAFDGGACAFQGFPACEFVHAVSGVFSDAYKTEKFGDGRVV